MSADIAALADGQAPAAASHTCRSPPATGRSPAAAPSPATPRRWCASGRAVPTGHGSSCATRVVTPQEKSSRLLRPTWLFRAAASFSACAGPLLRWRLPAGRPACTRSGRSFCSIQPRQNGHCGHEETVEIWEGSLPHGPPIVSCGTSWEDSVSRCGYIRPRMRAAILADLSRRRRSVSVATFVRRSAVSPRFGPTEGDAEKVRIFLKLLFASTLRQPGELGPEFALDPA